MASATLQEIADKHAQLVAGGGYAGPLGQQLCDAIPDLLAKTLNHVKYEQLLCRMRDAISRAERLARPAHAFITTTHVRELLDDEHTTCPHELALDEATHQRDSLILEQDKERDVIRAADARHLLALWDRRSQHTGAASDLRELLPEHRDPEKPPEREERPTVARLADLQNALDAWLKSPGRGDTAIMRVLEASRA